MKTSGIVLIIAAMIAAAMPALGVRPEPAKGPAHAEQAEVLEAMFLKFYKPVAVTVAPAAPQYQLPISLDKAENWAAIKEVFPTDLKVAQDAASKNGFVVTDRVPVGQSGLDDIQEFYESLKDQEIPIFVTSDSLLHLYHVQFDNLLMTIEQKEFVKALTTLCTDLMNQFAKAYEVSVKSRGPMTKEMFAARRCAEYFAVAVKLLDPEAEIPADIDKRASEEIALIEAHARFAPSPLFQYKEDYSQYVPRGHYTRTPELKRYFKAMMWLGRMTFLLKGKNDKIRDALVDEKEAEMQTLQAILIARVIPVNPQWHATWKRIYDVTAFFVGLADDLTIDDYNKALDHLASIPINVDLVRAVRVELAKYPSPEIYGGTGAQPVEAFTEENLDKMLDKTKGLRFFGQRFIPDGYVMGRLINLPYTGKGDPFTKVETPLGPIRGFARGLDVMHLLGSARAMEILTAEGDTEYAKYDEALAKLQAVFAGFDDAAWHRNLYWSWLAALRTLLADMGEGYPTFMRTAAWTDKQLHASLASWAQLRHDTILYAKQPYGMVGAGMPPKVKGAGYVEPVPHFYAALAALNRMTMAGLEEMKALDDDGRGRLQAMDHILTTLIRISIRELENKPLTAQDYDFIKDFGDSVGYATGNLETKSKTTVIVADVLTEPNTSQVLEEGTGRLRAMWVAYPTGDGAFAIGCGPVFSYHEFKQPMADRLTDEKWQTAVKANREPEPPKWTDTFLVPGEKAQSE